MRKKIIFIIIAIVLFVAGFPLLQGDYASFLQWWVVIFGLGIIFMPITALLFSSFHDKGYLFSKVIGIAFTAYLMWIFSSVHIMKFNTLSCILCTVLGLLLNITLFVVLSGKRKKEGNQSSSYSLLEDGTLDIFLAQELMFFALLLLFTYVRGFKPEAQGTEKFMDYGFMTSMMRSDYMPPQDFWFSGSSLNYYYVGQYVATFLTRLSFVKVSSGYNIMLMMVGTFAVVLPYSLVNNIMRNFLKTKEKISRVLPVISGWIAGIGVCIAGNMHYPIYKWLEPAVIKFFGMKSDADIYTKDHSYWFPDATRFIGYHPETHDKTIHEFPCYSFVLGDLHAHVINIMFVLTVLGLLFAWICIRKERQDDKITLWKEVLNPQIIAISFFVGLFHTTNFWDFPIYFVVSGAIILFTNLIVYNFKGKAVGVTALQGVFMFAASWLVCLPFTCNFDQISTAPKLCIAHTPLNQLIILWGLPIFMVIAFLCFTVADYQRRKKEYQHSGHKTSGIATFMEKLTVSDLFIITIGLCAIGLILMPEIIYIKDIYSGDYKRANTMFKLTYQAFIMFGLCFGYILMRLLMFGETKRQKKTAIVCLVLFTTSVCYVQNAVNGWYGNIFDISGYKGLDCTAFMDTNETYQDDVGAIDWLNKNVTGMQVVLEANGDSYTDYERVSVMTGLPTVLGWRTHEWLWKGDTKLLDKRAADIETIYTSNDKTQVKKLLEEYNVSYIYVGKLEQNKFTNINNVLLKSLGNVVYSSSASENKLYETYIVKLQK